MAKHPGEENFQERVIGHLSELSTDLQTFRVEVRQELGEIKEIIEPLSKAFDKDTETLVNHGRRITRLEKKAGFR